MSPAYRFDERGEHIEPYSAVEQGPMREGSLSLDERRELPPYWSFLDHGELPYTLQADHRCMNGSIVPVGTVVHASRRNGAIFMRTAEFPSRLMIVDVKRWLLLIDEAPRLKPSDCPELFLPA